MKISTLVLLTLLFFLVGCSNLKQEIWIHEDGSATLHAALKMSKDPLVDPGEINLFTRNIDQSDPNLLSFEASDDEDDTYLYYAAEATVADFAAFAANKAFGFTKFRHEQYPSGTLVLTQQYESINQDGGFPIPQQMLAMYEDVMAGSTATLIVHAPSIFYAEGLAIEEEEKGAVVRLEIPMLEAMNGMGTESFVVEYALKLAPTTAQSSTAVGINTNNDEATAGSGNAGEAPVGTTPTRTPTRTAAPTVSPTPVAEIVTVALTTTAEVAPLDSDGDWLTDEEERNLGTNPHLIDSDDDTFSDFEEQYLFHTDPLRIDPDTDGDGFADSVERDLFETDPARADTDKDGDLMPDQAEERLGTDPEQIDSDGDLLSDLLELYLLNSDPTTADADDDEDGFPDLLEEWVPTYLAETSCTVDATFQINNLIVIDPEEADTASISGGDEAYMVYVMSVSQDGGYYGPTADNQSGDPKYQGQGWDWQGEGFMNSQFTNFKTFGPFSAPCGYIVVYGAQMMEDDAFLGNTDMGMFIDGFQLLHQRLPFGWAQSESGTHHFQGVSYDGSYDYAMEYTFTAQIKRAAAPTPLVEQVAEQPSALAVDRSRLVLSEETERRLPDTYLSANERLTFRYVADDWTIVEPAAGRIPMSYTVLANGGSPVIPSEAASAVHIYDPVYIIETVARENYDDLEVADLFAAYINKTGTAGTTLHPSEPTEIQLGEKSALLWQPATENAHTWLAFQALDGSVNIVQFAMSADEFAAEELLWLSFAESLDYQAPSRRLDEIEKSLRQFIAGTAIGDLETVQAAICQRNRQTTEMVTGLFGAIFDVDVQGLTNAFLSFSSGWTELDTSALFFETIESSDSVAKVMISGVVTLNGENGRETVTFRRFNMTGRNIYQLEQDAGEWFVCD